MNKSFARSTVNPRPPDGLLSGQPTANGKVRFGSTVAGRRDHAVSSAPRLRMPPLQRRSLEPRVHQFSQTLQRLVDMADRPWEAWLAHAATITSSALCSWWFDLHLFGR